MATAFITLPGSSQICSPGNPCILSMGGSYGYPNPQAGCGSNYIDHYNKRFLRSHFDAGRQGDFTDDPVVIAFSQGMSVFGSTADTSDPLSLPDTALLAAALAEAEAQNTPFVIQLSTWGCQNNCFGTRSATVKGLMCHSEPCDHDHPENFRAENWMEAPDGGLGFTFNWCFQAYTLTYRLHAGAGNGGPESLQATFDRNMRHIVDWIATNITSNSAKRHLLVGVVIASETHFGNAQWGFDYSPLMLAGFRDDVFDTFGCEKDGVGCLVSINNAFGTNFLSLAKIIPPIESCATPLKQAYCSAWNSYRNEVLEGHLQRTVDLFVEEGVPSSYLFGHDLKSAGGFVAGPVLLPNRLPGLTSYSPALGVFNDYAGCVSSTESCREWTITEGFFSKSSCNNQDSDCYADDLDHIFNIGARFMQVMPSGLDGTVLLGSGFEKGIQKWGMRYSERYSEPEASLSFSPASGVLSGCIYDNDSVWRGPFVQNGGYGTQLDLNDVAVRVEVTGRAPLFLNAEVTDSSPWCPAGGNLNHTITGLNGSESVSILAQDYPTDDFIEVLCHNCDDAEGPRIWVEAPSNNQTVNGSFLVAGWATDASGVDTVTFSIDNKMVTLAGFVYGTPRGDVCNVHGDLNDPNCPDVGWHGTLNTAAFASGPYTLKVTVTDPQGNSTILNRSFQVQNVSADQDGPRMWVDTPSHNQTVNGNILIVGWATDAAGVDSVTFKVDNMAVPLAGFVYGTSRGDVCDVHGDLNDPSCPNIGWEGTLDTAALPNGSHALKVTAADLLGNPNSLSRTFQIQNTSADHDGPRMYIDRPSHNQTVGGNILVSGWATDAAGVNAVTFEVDSTAVTLTGFVYGTSRGDVCNVHADLDDPNCPNVGWQGTLTTTAFASGIHTLGVAATDPHGNSTISSRTFQIQN